MKREHSPRCDMGNSHKLAPAGGAAIFAGKQQRACADYSSQGRFGHRVSLRRAASEAPKLLRQTT